MGNLYEISTIISPAQPDLPKWTRPNWYGAIQTKKKYDLSVYCILLYVQYSAQAHPTSFAYYIAFSREKK